MSFRILDPIPLREFFPLSDLMDLRHQSSAMRIIMLGGEDTHPWSATKVGNPIPATMYSGFVLCTMYTMYMRENENLLL